jgi:hypothetical protein
MNGLQGRSGRCPHPEIETRFLSAPIHVVFVEVKPVGWFVFINISRKLAIFVFNAEFLP